MNLKHQDKEFDSFIRLKNLVIEFVTLVFRDDNIDLVDTIDMFRQKTMVNVSDIISSNIPNIFVNEWINAINREDLNTDDELKLLTDLMYRKLDRLIDAFEVFHMSDFIYKNIKEKAVFMDNRYLLEYKPSDFNQNNCDFN